jgi:hypothetical protein
MKSYIFHQMISNTDKFLFYKKYIEIEGETESRFGFNLCFNYICNDSIQRPLFQTFGEFLRPSTRYAFLHIKNEN